ncbi:MAG: hypothetical protein E6J34_05850 [Chloroflexi bacterium]|nr:MAG: hypothetical protein E6J34_05850 [Chloroflexota bacterium]
MIRKDAGGDAPPTFLSIGNTIIAVAHIVTVDQRENGSVEILLTHDNEVLTLNDEEARLFMELFKQHSQIVTKTVQQTRVLPFAPEQDVHTRMRDALTHASVDLSLPVRPLLYISQNEVSQGLLQDVPLMAVVLHINRRSSLSLGQFLASLPELKYAQYLSLSGVLLAYNDALPSNTVLSCNFLTELIGYIIKEWCKEQKDA